MSNRIADITLRQAAIVTGISILIMTVAAGYAMDIVLGKLVVYDNAAATTQNIQNSEVLFRTGILSWIIILICDVLAAWGLYVFLRPINKSLSLLMAWLRLVYVAILGTALLNFVQIMLLVSSDTYLAVLGTDQVQAQVLFLLNAFNQTWSVGLIVFGLHILILGYLSLRSGYIPKIFGILLIIAFLGYMITNLANLLLPDYENYKTTLGLIFIIPMVAGEVGLAIWLLIRGGNVQIGH